MGIVEYRGQIPATALFVAEAPGRTEDLYGEPLIGPAGMLFNRVLELITEEVPDFTFCLTNTVHCIPLEDRQTREPTEREKTSCAPRLRQLIIFSQPRFIVAVGQVAANWLTGDNVAAHRLTDGFLDKKPIPLIQILHPSAILRMPEELQTGAIHRCVAQVLSILKPLEIQ